MASHSEENQITPRPRYHTIKAYQKHTCKVTHILKLHQALVSSQLHALAILAKRNESTLPLGEGGYTQLQLV
jgi:hypothetical protein